MLAVHEAVANGVEHGSDSLVRVEGSANNGGLVVEVKTKGLWASNDEAIDVLAEGGRGLTLMRGLTDDLEVLVDDECVTIRLRPSHI